MEYSDEMLELFNDAVVVESGNDLEILSLVDPDGVVVSDGEDSIRVSMGSEVNQALIEADGQTNIVSTTGDSRAESVHITLQELSWSYTGDLTEDSLRL